MFLNNNVQWVYLCQWKMYRSYSNPTFCLQNFIRWQGAITHWVKQCNLINNEIRLYNINLIKQGHLIKPCNCIWQCCLIKQINQIKEKKHIHDSSRDSSEIDSCKILSLSYPAKRVTHIWSLVMKMSWSLLNLSDLRVAVGPWRTLYLSWGRLSRTIEDSTSHTATKAELSELNPSGRDPQAHRSNQWPTRVYLVISCCSGPLMLHSSYQMIPVSIHTQTHVERKEERKEVRERGQHFNCWPRRAGESRGKATSTNCEESREWKERVKERKKIKTKGSDSGFRVSHLIIRPVSS